MVDKISPIPADFPTPQSDGLSWSNPKPIHALQRTTGLFIQAAVLNRYGHCSPQAFFLLDFFNKQCDKTMDVVIEEETYWRILRAVCLLNSVCCCRDHLAIYLRPLRPKVRPIFLRTLCGNQIFFINVKYVFMPAESMSFYWSNL